ncbi:PREDICTED: ninjurin-1-like [Polistes dominula]|uniref:Ninjurin-1-like n=1 Tax=Polistes dominula TaxID=743375 RepID=A0ABM1ICC5_POLDO|nr:PREDICTED: ninjurin-1-like [Polistes dominula]XP_015177862.1 PREDICTED: ninjurin-1-like [Polistes dominula]
MEKARLDNEKVEISLDNKEIFDKANDVEKIDGVKEIVVSVDTTDKKSQAYSARAANSFAAKKTVAQGMMDVALITANANQLRYLIEYQRNSPTFYVILILIVISLLLQIAVGVSLIFKGRFDIKGQSKSINARKINNYVVVGVFLITIINVFIASFSITTPNGTGPVSMPT